MGVSDVVSPEDDLRFRRAWGPPTARYPEGCVCWLLDRNLATRDKTKTFFLVGPGTFRHEGVCPVHEAFHRRNVVRERVFIGTLLTGFTVIVLGLIGQFVWGGWPWGVTIGLGYAVVFVAGSIVAARLPTIDVPKDVTW